MPEAPRGDLFSGLGALGWLDYNEEARTDDDPTTVPISFEEFDDRQRDGLDAVNIPRDGGVNPFAVANEFLASVSITQKVFDLPSMLRVFSGEGTSSYVDQRTLEAERQKQVVIGDVRTAFYNALLAQEQARVSAQSVQRTKESRDEVAQRVAQGVIPKMQRLSMDVELANQESELMNANNRVTDALGDLKFLLGLPVNRELYIRGSLTVTEASPYLTLASTDAYNRALLTRPDIEQARVLHKFTLNEVRAIKSTRLPLLDVFANLSYSGRVPDTRIFAVQDEDDPFTYTREHNTYFSDAYWQPSANVGFQMTWTIFNGLQRRSNIQRARIKADQAFLGIKQLEESIRLEIDTALRSLATAGKQILDQETNVANAELNYEYARSRTREGVASSLELRTASQQLDVSRLNYLQAAHNFLIAQNAVEVAMGVPIDQQSDMRLALQPMMCQRPERSLLNPSLVKYHYLLLAFVFVIAACGETDSTPEMSAESSGPPVISQHVATLKLSPTTYEDVIIITGTIAAINDAVLSAEAPGTVEMLAPLGQHVMPDTPIAHMDDALLKSSVEQAQAQLENSTAGLELAQDNFRRMQPLYEDSIISALEFTQIKTALRQAEAAVRQTDALLDLSNKQFANAVIRAPFAGTVEQHFVEVGEQVNPGSPIIRIVDASHVKVSVGVPERYAGDIKVGAAIELRVLSYDQEPLEGRVTFAGSAIDPANRTFAIEAQIENRDGHLKPEMIAEVFLVREKLDDVLVIPRAALIRDETGNNVFVVIYKDGVPYATRRRVSTGPNYSGLIVITEGLTPNDEVVIRGQSVIANDDLLEIDDTYSRLDEYGVPVSDSDAETPAL